MTSTSSAPPRESAGSDLAEARSGRRAVLTWVGAYLVLAGVGAWVIGPPAVLVLLATWLVAATLQLTCRGLAGGAAWAGAIIVEVLLLTALSALAAVLAPGPIGQVQALVMLGIPVALALGGLGTALVLRRGRDRPVTDPPRPGLAFAAHLTVFAAVGWIGTEGSQGAAWAMSGDAPTHVLVARDIIDTGGLTLAQVKAYPALFDSVIGVLSAAGTRTGLAPGELMLHDTRALVAVYALAVVGVACLVMATLLELLPSAVRAARFLPPAVTAVVLVGAATSATSFVLGTSLVTGFVTSYATLLLTLAATVVAMRFATSPSRLGLCLISASVVLTFISWTLLVAIPVGLGAYALTTALRDGRIRLRGQLGWSAAGSTVVGAVLLVAVVSVSQRAAFVDAFQTVGAIVAPPRHVVLVLVCATVGLAAVLRSRTLTGPLVAVITGAVVLAAVTALPANTAASYYPAKMAYLLASSFIWLPFAPILWAAVAARTAPGDGVRRWGDARAVVASLGLAVAVLAVVQQSSPITSPVQLARDGWKQPSATVIAETARQADRTGPFVLWAWSNPVDDQAADAWAVMTWSTDAAGASRPVPRSLPKGARYWAATMTSQLPQLCQLKRAYPRLLIVTRDGTLREQLRAACPRPRARIELTPSS